jgi:DNA-binding winged helix-turn-helix (wHTH) protein
MRWPSKVFSRGELIDRVWGPDFAIGDHTLDVHIHALRQHLNRVPNHLCKLVTIKKVGFKLTSVSLSASTAAMTSHRSHVPNIGDAVARLTSSGSRRDGNELPISLSSTTAQKNYVNRDPRGRLARSFRNIRSVRLKRVVGVD